MEIRDHLLVAGPDEPIAHHPSPNQSSLITPRFLLMHYTAGRTLDGAVAWMSSEESKVSAHLVIGREGEIVQLVAFNRRAWHAGPSRWGHLEGMNLYAIGIELVNAGKLHSRRDGAWFDAQGEVVPDEEVRVARHRHEGGTAGWHRYTEPQFEAAVRVGRLLCSTYRLSDILGHDDVSPNRKTDPGPAFPMAIFREWVFGRGIGTRAWSGTSAGVSP